MKYTLLYWFDVAEQRALAIVHLNEMIVELQGQVDTLNTKVTERDACITELHMETIDLLQAEVKRTNKQLDVIAQLKSRIRVIRNFAF